MASQFDLCDNCADDALIQLSNQDCSSKLGRIQKLAIAKRTNTFTDITDESEWTTALTSATLAITVTPKITNQSIPASEFTTIGGAGSNDTPDGAEKPVSESGVTISGNFRNLDLALVNELRDLGCLTTSETFGVYFIYNNKVQSLAAPDYRPIPFTALTIGTTNYNGAENDDLTPFSLYMPVGWTDGAITTFTPTFNPAELVNIP